MRKTLEEFVEKNNLLARTEASFATAFANYQKEDEEGYQRFYASKKLKLEFRYVAYKIDIIYGDLAERVEITYAISANDFEHGLYSLIVSYPGAEDLDDRGTFG